MQRKRHAAPFSAVSSHGKYDIMSTREKQATPKAAFGKRKVGTGYDIRIIRSDQDNYESWIFSDRDLFCTYVSKVKTKAMAMYLHVAFGIFILDHSRCIPGCLLFKPSGVSEYDA